MQTSLPSLLRPLLDTSHWLPPLVSVGGSANCQFAFRH